VDAFALNEKEKIRKDIWSQFVIGTALSFPGDVPHDGKISISSLRGNLCMHGVQDQLTGDRNK
jgi:hypothetical protein